MQSLHKLILGKFIEIFATRQSYFKAKMHQIGFRRQDGRGRKGEMMGRVGEGK